MARTKQTARKSNGGIAPRLSIIVWNDRVVATINVIEFFRAMKQIKKEVQAVIARDGFDNTKQQAINALLRHSNGYTAVTRDELIIDCIRARAFDYHEIKVFEGSNCTFSIEDLLIVDEDAEES